MRIKYRAWHKAERKMYQVVDMYFSKTGELQTVRLLAEHNGMQYPTNDIPINEVELMQYTGIDDKNGKEIYEGDIVTAYLETYPTYDNPDDCIHMIVGAVNFYSGSFLLDKFNFCNDGIYDFEVIGDIHRNP